MIQLDALLQLFELRRLPVKQWGRPSIVAPKGRAEVGGQSRSRLLAFGGCPVGRRLSESLPGLFVLLLPLETLDDIVMVVARSISPG